MAKMDREYKALEKMVIGDSEAAEVIEKLRRGKARIRRNWVQGSLAEDRDGNDVRPTSEAAVGWCALGAVDVLSEDRLNPAGRALEVVLDPEWDRVFEFNDDVNDKGEVVKLFDKAINHVKKHGVPTPADIRKRRRAIENGEDG